ncbi:helix-turn-helix domain-containing protein [Streptomyces actuosus]|uniref:Helix-turn-helix domain-containing protein n=1 Tax=Streptomyces actuosus TaxID=1885 RepID=A0ABS2VNI5_STRAS|nr:helix-turn-helix domain-containing protein [Streptomyces actuosus]MBN0044673.1 helix-turn-helix domain-containing protein [Streptomyces actuosus]
MYTERPSRPAGAVVWTNTPSGPGGQGVLPDGCMDLLWSEGRLLVAGPDTQAYVTGGPPVTWTGIRFRPGVAPALLGVPAHELRDRRVELTDLWSAGRARRLSGLVEAAADPETGLEAAALTLAAQTEAYDPQLGLLVAALDAGRPVAAAADELGIGARRLHRRSLTAFGYGPKTLARILRFRRALALARSGVPRADTAARAGYADQAHLARDVKQLAGRTLGELLAGR